MTAPDSIDEIPDPDLHVPVDRAGKDHRSGARHEVAVDRAGHRQAAGGAGDVTVDLGTGLDRGRASEDDEVASHRAEDPNRAPGDPHGARHVAQHVDGAAGDIERAVHRPVHRHRAGADGRVAVHRPGDRDRSSADVEIVVDRLVRADRDRRVGAEVAGCRRSGDDERGENGEQQGADVGSVEHADHRPPGPRDVSNRRETRGRRGPPTPAGNHGPAVAGHAFHADSPRSPILHSADYQPLTGRLPPWRTAMLAGSNR